MLVEQGHQTSPDSLKVWKLTSEVWSHTNTVLGNLISPVITGWAWVASSNPYEPS